NGGPTASSRATGTILLSLLPRSKDFAQRAGRALSPKALKPREAQRKTGYSSAYDIACLYADLGDKDEAFRWLNIAYQERDIGLLRLKTDFRLDSLRSDPRLAGLVRKVGLPH